MTHMMPSRRNLLKIGAGAAGGLLIGFRVDPGAWAADTAPASGAFEPNAFVSIAPDGKIQLIMPNVEVGQGIYTSASMLIAEELGVGLDQIEAVAAPPDETKYRDPSLGIQATGGSASIRGSWIRLRQAGAAARVLLVQAAASQWNVDPSACQASRGVVTHTATGRTASYGQLAGAAARLPAPQDVKLKDPSQFTLIGTRQKRLDSPGKVDGSLPFGLDVQMPGLKIGTVAASPVPGGKLRAIDEAAARRVPGVRDVVQLDDVVAVIGDHMWAAISGLKAAAPVWDDGPNAGVNTAGIIQDLANASSGDAVVAKSVGEAGKAIAGAAKRLDAVYQLPFLAHAPMEPINTTIHVRPDGAEVWVGTQVPVRAQMAVAKVLGLPPEKVVLHNQYMGGAFGRRLYEESLTQAARVAQHLDYPVKLVWTREEDIQHDPVRPYYYDKISAGLDAGGKIAGWSHRVTGSSCLARFYPAGMKMGGKFDPDATECAADTPYDFPAQLTEYARHETEGVETGWWRGVGPTHNVFVVESFVDEMAALAGVDPVEFRRRMLGKNPRGLAALNLVAEKSGWGGALPKGTGRGVCLQFAFDTYVATVLEVDVSDRGEIHLRHIHAAVDCGPVVNPDTVEAQIQGGLIFGLSMALYSEITHRGGRVDQSNFHDYRVLRMNEAPSIDVHIIDNPTAPIGGIGETGTAAAAAALGNAIFAATGRRLRRIPFGTGQLTQQGSQA